MEIKEIWRGIENFRGLYEASSLGRVRSLPRGPRGKHRIIGSRGQRGYMKVTLSKQGIHHHFNTHTIIADAFLPKPETSKELCVNHIDGNKGNNIIQNLEWVTYKENSAHALRTGLSPRGENSKAAKLTDENVLAIREKYRNTEARELAEEYGVGVLAIRRIVRGRTWQHLPVINYSGRKRSFSKDLGGRFAKKI